MAKTTLDGYYEALSTELARDNQVFDRNVAIKEIDTKFRKIGDGETPYNDLPYFGGGPNDGGADLPEWQASTAYNAGQEFTFRTISTDAVDIDGTAIPANKTMIGAYRVGKTSSATLTNAEMALIELRGGAPSGVGQASIVDITSSPVTLSAATHANNTLNVTSATEVILNVDTEANAGWVAGTNIDLIRNGVGEITPTAINGTVINKRANYPAQAQYETVTLTYQGADIWVLS